MPDEPGEPGNPGEPPRPARPEVRTNVVVGVGAGLLYLVVALLWGKSELGVSVTLAFLVGLAAFLATHVVMRVVLAVRSRRQQA